MPTQLGIRRAGYLDFVYCAQLVLIYKPTQRAILHRPMLIIPGVLLRVQSEIEYLNMYRYKTVVTSRCMGGTMSVGRAQRGGTQCCAASAPDAKPEATGQVTDLLGPINWKICISPDCQQLVNNTIVFMGKEGRNIHC